MKKLFIASLLLGSASLVHADYKLVNVDGSSLTSLCVAAAEAPSSLLDIARSHGITSAEIDTVRCNDLPLKRFVAKYGKKENPVLSSTEIPGYLLRKTDESPLTELCAAALISDSEFSKVKELHFRGESEIESELLCNGEPLKAFVRKFRNAGVRLAGR